MKCQKAYKYKRGLRRHERRCVVYVPASLQALIKSEAPFEEGELEELSPQEEREAWACTCGKSYKYQRSFIKHMGVCRRQDSANELAAEDGDGETSENEDAKRKKKKKKSVEETIIIEEEISPSPEKEKMVVLEKEKSPVPEKSPEKSSDKIVEKIAEKVQEKIAEKVPEKVPEKTEKEKEADKLLMENLLKLTTKREEPVLKGSTIIVTRVEVEEKAD
jgi:hypothetical protein